ncbi:hypothetical protein WJX73_005538 [Symbiochloris irregularis]|uniref:Uncharacterized protein n=1 Tax=Symbiochloris irregularis TaxID=706552 RepID=A0AAW1NPR8_9CHLO
MRVKERSKAESDDEQPLAARLAQQQDRAQQQQSGPRGSAGGAAARKKRSRPASVLTSEAGHEPARTDAEKMSDEFQESQRPNTVKVFDQHFKKWRFLFFDENGKRRLETLDGDLTTCKGAMNATLFCGWVAKSQPGHKYNRKADEAAASDMTSCATVLQQELTNQFTSQSKAACEWRDSMLPAHVPFKQALKTALTKLAEKSRRTAMNKEPRAKTGQQTFDIPQLLSHFKYIGPAPYLVWSAVVAGSKVQKNGQVAHVGFGRQLAQQPDAMKKHLDESDVLIAKRTHTGRMAAASTLAISGEAQEEFAGDLQAQAAAQHRACRVLSSMQRAREVPCSSTVQSLE